MKNQKCCNLVPPVRSPGNVFFFCASCCSGALTDGSGSALDFFSKKRQNAPASGMSRESAGFFLPDDESRRVFRYSFIEEQLSLRHGVRKR